MPVLTHAPFGDRLAEALKQTKSALCVGIDPHPSLMTSLFCDKGQVTIDGLRAFSFAVIEAARGLVPAIKPQAALFESYGPDGMSVLAEIAKAGQDAGLLVIMDAKRGDIGSTSQAYANAYLGPDAPFPSDALTVNPWMGLDTLEPFMTRAKETGSGLFILVRTSNPGASDLQELSVSTDPDRLVYQQLAHDLAPLIEAETGAHNLSSFGIVAGATVPDQAAELRAILPHAPFLIPGFGAQGAGPAHATTALSKHAGHLGGGLVNSSRGITFCPDAQQASNISAFKDAVKQAIGEQTDALNSVL